MALAGTNLKVGDSGDAVRELQTWLASQGYDVGAIDGVWGAQTNAAVAAWKADVGLPGGGDLSRTGLGVTSWPYMPGGELEGGSYNPEYDVRGVTYDDTGHTGDSGLPSGVDIPPDESPAEPPEGSTPTFPGVMSGGFTVRVAREGQEDLFLQMYEYPEGSGRFVAWQFANAEQVAQTFGAGHTITTRTEADLERAIDWEILNTADEVIGVPGDFNQLVQQTVQQAAAQAGLGDPTIISQMLDDAEMREILFKSTVGHWTAEQTMAAKRQTSFWTETLYPGIEFFYGMTSEPERAWAQYAANVASGLNRLGITRDEDGSYRSHIGSLLDSGVSDENFVNYVDTFVRAEQSPEFRDILNQWTTQELGTEITFEDVLDVLEGNTAPEMAAIVEQATLQFQAEQQGLEISSALITRIAQNTDLSESQARAAFGTVEQQILALDRAILQGRFGLSQDELIEAAAGIAPSSGRSIAEVQNLARKVALEEGFSDDTKIDLFTGFNPRTGTPFKPGLNPLAPERD